MKSKFLTLSIIALLAITSISCSKDEPAATTPTPAPVVVNPPSTTTGTYINATIDGVAFGTIAGPQLRATRTSNGAITVIEVIGTHSTAETNGSRRGISINLNSITTVGTYNVASNNSAQSVVLLHNVVNAQFAVTNYFCGSCNTTGTVTITAIDAAKVEGTFSFTGANDNCSVIKTITAGSFRGVF